MANIFHSLFHKKEMQKPLPYDSDLQKPVIRCSICTGEQAAGFKNKKDGKFTEIMLIRTEEDLEAFKKMYGLTDIEKEY